MLRRFFNRLSLPLNRSKMRFWTAKVDRIVSQPPGTNEGFPQADIDLSRKVTFGQMSTWEIVCEEVLDTAHPHAYYERALSELNRRGICDAEYQKMRHFAWLTVGWLHFEKMVWEWQRFDKQDIDRAIERQFSEGWISKANRDRWREFADRYA